LFKKLFKYQAKTSPNPLGIEIKYAKGNYLYDNKNKKYLDFIAGVSVCNLGHCHPKVIKAIENQIKRHLHVMIYGEFIQKAPVLLAKKLVDLLPKNQETLYLTNSGTEAVEGALKLAKKVTNRYEIIAAKNSYHGSTHGSLSVIGIESQKKGYRPLIPFSNFIEYNNEKDLNKITQKTAAVILETIQGGAGFILPRNNYLKKVQSRCKKVGALFILDEIQTGFGRTGKFFGFELFKVMPDIVVMGKAMGGGLPIGGFTSASRLMRKFEDKPKLGHITTFGGNPLIAAAGLATVKKILKSNLMSKIAEKEKIFRDNLIHPKIIRIQGAGLMLAPILKSKGLASKLILKCLNKGLLLFWLLWEKKAIRISPPLTISKREIIDGCKIICQTLDEI
jgi:acetylornithine/succinyldiaminopimelate/putrescine aminotransferase